jgi:hypothetical protein
LATARFNCIAILDAIPEGELSTARSLREQLRDLRDFQGVAIEVQYFRIDSPHDLDVAASDLELEARNGLIPWLHLEGHGLDDDSGFRTANGMSCSWEHLKNAITPINITTGFNLVLLLATCYGGSFTSVIETTDTAPVLGLIGPSKSVPAGRLEVDFRSFYLAFFEAGSMSAAIEALTAQAARNTYYVMNAQQFFMAVWAAYRRKYSTPSADKARVTEFRQLLKRRFTFDWVKRWLRDKEQQQFNRFRDKYFMWDRDLKNRERFPVSFEEAEQYAKGVIAKGPL